jgi:ribose-phosphate pyrophosphokinase
VKVLYFANSRTGPALAAALGGQSCELALRRFPDGECLVRIDTQVHGEDVVIAVSLDRPDEKTLPVLFAADAARELGARRVILAAPYLAYMRQDMRFHPGEAVTSRSFARLVSSMFDALVTVEPHLHRWSALSEVYSIPARALSAAPAIARWIRANVTAPLIVGPDGESEPWVAEVARLSGAPYTVLEKSRSGAGDVALRLRDPLPPGVRSAVLMDDIISTGQTLASAAAALRAAGLNEPVAIGVHALLDANARAALRAAGIFLLATCDTVEHPTNQISVLPELTQAVRDLLAP